MKRRITWIRHGESTWNAIGKWQGHTDTELSDLGREQAKSLAPRLVDNTFDAIYTSDLQRARVTGELALPNTELIVDARLREINFGVYEGKHRDVLTEEEKSDVYGWWRTPYDRKLDGGESMQCLQDRVQSWMDELPTECNICVFTHGGVVRNAVWQIVKPPAAAEWSVVIDNTSLTTIEYTTDRNLIHRVNDAAHLDTQGCK